MGFHDIVFSTSGGIATIAINRPEKKNALRIKTFEEIVLALEACAADDQIGVVVITGTGNRVFCAGGDLEMALRDLNSQAAMRAHHFDRMLRISTLIVQLDKPVVCAVNGICIGGAAEIACFCDLVVASDNASFSFNGTKIGGCSWWGAPQILPLQVGAKRAQEILLLARPVGAAEAERIGLVNRTVPAAEFRAEVDRLCQELLDLSPAGLSATKATLRQVFEVFFASIPLAAEMNAAIQMGPQARAAFDAFVAKRPLSWRDVRPAPGGE